MKSIEMWYYVWKNQDVGGWWKNNYEWPKVRQSKSEK